MGGGRITNIQENFVTDSIIETSIDHSCQGVNLKGLNEGTTPMNIGVVTSGVNVGDEQSCNESASVEDRHANTEKNVIVDIIYDTNINHSSQGVEHQNEGINIGGLPSDVNVGDEQSENRVKEGFNTSLKRSISLGSTLGRNGFSTKAERTVAARLHQLEQSLASIMEKTSCMGQVDVQPTETNDESTMEVVARRMDYIESVLHGFGHNKEADASVERKVQHLEEIMFVKEEDSALATAEAIEGAGYAKLLKPESNHDQSMPGVLPQGPCDNSRLGGNEGNAKSIAIHDLPISSSLPSDSKHERQVGPLGEVATEKRGGGYDVVAIGRQVAELSDRLQKQISELLISLDDKVSIIELEGRIQEIRNLISACSTEGTTGFLVFDKEQKILELISNLESNMMDKDSYKRQLEHLESDMNSLICREISKLRLDLSTNIESQRHELSCLRTVEPILPNDSSVKDEYVNARIQEATAALSASLDERLEKMRSIENEMDAFSSKLAEKPSQDQVDSVLRLLEKRIGHDEELRGMMDNMKLGEWYLNELRLIILQKRCFSHGIVELKHKMSKGEVMAIVKQTVRQAKLGMQNTKNTLMIGATPAYCLGCGNFFPSGVNGMRALRANHDALPLSSATFHSDGGSMRPISRDVNKVHGLGSFAPSSTFFPKNINKQR